MRIELSSFVEGDLDAIADISPSAGETLRSCALPGRARAPVPTHLMK